LAALLSAFILELILGVAAAVALRLAPRLNSVQAYNAAQAGNAVHAVAVGALALVVVLVVISTIRLMRVLSTGTYYALVIETAGTPRRVLVSAEENVVTNLVNKIMDAIDNPAITYHTRVENYVDMRNAQGVQLGNYNTQRNTFNAR
jgi:hypothetical protein